MLHLVLSCLFAFLGFVEFTFLWRFKPSQHSLRMVANSPGNYVKWSSYARSFYTQYDLCLSFALFV